jgi:acyl carrier protein
MEYPARLRIEEEIRRLLVSELAIPDSIVAKSGPTTPLLGRGIGLDSLETLSLVAGIERTFGIQIEDRDLTVRLFKDLATLAEYVLVKAPAQLAVRSGDTTR